MPLPSPAEIRQLPSAVFVRPMRLARTLSKYNPKEPIFVCQHNIGDQVLIIPKSLFNLRTQALRERTGDRSATYYIHAWYLGGEEQK